MSTPVASNQHITTAGHTHLTQCNQCGKTAAKMKICTGCYFYHYCDVTCQKKDWKRHKTSCIEMKKALGELKEAFSHPDQDKFMEAYQKVDCLSFLVGFWGLREAINKTLNDPSGFEKVSARLQSSFERAARPDSFLL